MFELVEPFACGSCERNQLGRRTNQIGFLQLTPVGKGEVHGFDHGLLKFRTRKPSVRLITVSKGRFLPGVAGSGN